MSANEIDISWQTLRSVVQDWAGTSAELDEMTPLTGGSINTTLALTTRDKQKAVLKITPHRVDRAHADEAHQLKLMRSLGLPVPEVYLCHIGTLERPFSYILMQFVEGVDLAAAKAACGADDFDDLQAHLASLVLTLHAQTATHYTRATAQESRQFEHWSDCYRDIFEPIWQELEKSPALPNKPRKVVAKVHERLGQLLAHEDCPRLVHWDIWATNVLAKPDDKGKWRITALLDPNCKYAHAEAELAYLELFHTVTPTFLKAYQQVHRLPNEYHRVRKPVYQLYSLLNHLRLFGSEYLKMTLGAIERMSSIV